MKTKLLFLLIFTISIFANAQIGFQDHVVLDNSFRPDGPRQVRAGDINGDGKMDLVSASILDNTIAWYENRDGLGDFRIRQVISNDVNGAISIHLDDIDGDGDIDVLAVAYYGNSIFWYENLDGLGNFSLEQIINEEVNGPNSIIAADIDGDGDLDVITEEEWSFNVIWFENLDGLGDFGEKQYISYVNVGAECIVAVDIDGDNDIDVLSSGGNNAIYWFENIDGQGNFNYTPNQIITGKDASTVFIADIDGDNDPDIFSGGEQGIFWFENVDGEGNFGPRFDISSSSASSIFASDLDGDNDLDVLSTVNNFIYFFENLDGLGTFANEVNLGVSLASARSVISVDLDNDDNMDVVAVGYADDEIIWTKNDGEANFGEMQEISRRVKGANSVFATDIDGDGDKDLLSASSAYSNSKIAWYENYDGHGSFNAQYIISTNMSSVSVVDATDIDGDGDMDVISGSSHDSKIVWYENTDGQGAFEESIIYSSNSNGGLIDLYIDDVDGDGDMDVLSSYHKTTTGNSKIAWHENKVLTNGNFTTHTISTNIDKATSVHAADINGDGYLDALSTSSNDNTIAWYENIDGQGNFGQKLIISQDATEAHFVVTGDMDGDEDIDVIASSWDFYNGLGKLEWFENLDGMGNFGEPNILFDNDKRSHSLFIADLDLDGDNDILFITSDLGFDNNQVGWFENIDGQGNFGTIQSISTEAIGPQDINAADMDGDGDLDVLTASSGDSKIAWYENLGINKNEILGTIRLDTNSTGCENFEPGVPNFKVNTDNGNEALTTFTLTSGLFQLFPDEGDYTTTISPVSLPEYYSATPDSHLSSFVGFGNVDTANFCIEATDIVNNLNIFMFPVNDARPGFEALYRISYQNIGTTQLDGNIVLEFDESKMNFSNASIIPSSQTGNSVIFDFFDFYPFETGTIDIVFSIFPPPTVNIDDILGFTAIINPIEDDYNANDNIFNLEQVVTGSYDPNDITVLEGDKILYADIDDYLHYVIRFQNTGNAHALFVKVTNNLDDNLDWNTFQVEDISHNYTVEIHNGNEISFNFNGIYLPDSTTNEPESHGFIAYKIKPNVDIQIGDIISNNASIYFDFNPAIETNTVTTEIVEIIGINSYIPNSFSVFPIPTTGVLLVKSKVSIDHLEIYNKLGQIVHQNSKQNSIDISNLSPGLYYCKIVDKNGNSGIQKVIKK